jgi:NADH-quinone oxidoreductase subunit A
VQYLPPGSRFGFYSYIFAHPLNAYWFHAIFDGSMNTQYLSEFAEVLLFIIGSALFVIITFMVSRMVRPNRPNPEKLSSYETGEETTGPAWTQFNIRFYIVALIFLLFEVEIIFLFPWSTVYGRTELIKQTDGLWGWFAMIEMVIFILVLALGLAYAWVNGYLEWVKPKPDPTEFKSAVPKNLYEKINEKYK